MGTVAEPRLNRVLGDRPRRVILLLWAIVVLSLADLFVTLTHLQSIGMVEANPVAAFLIRSTGSPWALILFKAGTVAVCVMLLYRVRNHRQGELAAWLALVILVGVSVMWHYYSEASDAPETVRIARLIHGDQWLTLD